MRRSAEWPTDYQVGGVPQGGPARMSPRFEHATELGLAGAMLVILIFRPAGLAGGRERPAPPIFQRLIERRARGSSAPL